MQIIVMPLPIAVAVGPKADGTKEEGGFLFSACNHRRRGLPCSYHE
jgi:hypothetical protein